VLPQGISVYIRPTYIKRHPNAFEAEVFMVWMLFMSLLSNQQCQSTKVQNKTICKTAIMQTHVQNSQVAWSCSKSCL